jgi:AcrR family transcriptional regulator
VNEKEQKILDTSLVLFVEKGFHGTSTAEIAKTAGVATGTLFHYFKTKEELIDRLYI